MRPFWGDDHHRVLCLGNATRQADAVLRRSREPRKSIALRDQWRRRSVHEQVTPGLAVTGDFLDYDDVTAKFDETMEWLARTYVHAMNCIHYARQVFL
jgi:formate C-acetyltransferase